MLDTTHTFNKLIQKYLEDNYPDVYFYSEPSFQEIKYPAVVIRYAQYEPTQKLSIWEVEAQFDVLFTNFERAKSFLLARSLMRYLTITADCPGSFRRTPKKKWVDDNGKKLDTPQEYLQSNDIMWRLAAPLVEVSEDSLPELMRYTFSVTLQFKDG